MADNTDPHGTGIMGEKPSQGIFIGYLALGLLVFALLVAVIGISAGAMHGFQ